MLGIRQRKIREGAFHSARSQSPKDPANHFTTDLERELKFLAPLKGCVIGGTLDMSPRYIHC
jgi:hypothetical protein